MKITQDVREYAAQREIVDQAALGLGMKEKGGSLWRRKGGIYPERSGKEFCELVRTNPQNRK